MLVFASTGPGHGVHRHDPALETPPLCHPKQAGQTVAHCTGMESEAMSGEGQRNPQADVLCFSSTGSQALL